MNPRFVSVILLLVMVLSSITFVTVSSAENHNHLAEVAATVDEAEIGIRETIGDFVYETSSVYEVRGYVGTSPNMVIPSTVNGYTVRKIGDFAFKYKKIESAVIPETVTKVGNFIFEDCTKLKSVSIPESMTYISYGMFEGSGLEQIALPNSINSIGDRAFSYCYSLESISIPNSVTSIGKQAFNSCTNLTEVYYYGTEEEWNKIHIGESNNELLNAKIYFVGLDEISSIWDIDVSSGIYPCIEGYHTVVFATYSNEWETVYADAWSNEMGHISLEPGLEMKKCAEEGNKTIFIAYIPDSFDKVIFKNGGTESTQTWDLKTAYVTLHQYWSVGYVWRVEVEDAKFYNVDNTKVFEGNEYTDKDLGQSVEIIFSVSEEAGADKESVSGMAFGYIGDSNCDDSVNIKDATVIQKSVAGLTSLSLKQEVLSDVDSNGTINVKDATVVQKYIAGFSLEHKIMHLVYEEAEHKHHYAKFIVEPGCVAGHTEYICICGSKMELDYVAKITTHSYTEEVIEPTETEFGYTLFTCIYCGYSIKDIYTSPTNTPSKTTYNCHYCRRSVTVSEPYYLNGYKVCSTCYSDGNRKCDYCGAKGVTLYTIAVGGVYRFLCYSCRY